MKFRLFKGYLILLGAALLSALTSVWAYYRLNENDTLLLVGLCIGCLLGIYIYIKAWPQIEFLVAQSTTWDKKDISKLFGPQKHRYFFAICLS